MNLLMASGGTLSETIGTALATVQTDVMSYIGTVAPIALGIMGTFIAVKLGLKFFRSVAK